MSSLFVQMICVPTFTESVAGEKVKLSILTSAFPATTGEAATPGGTAWKLIKTVITEAAKQRIQSVLLQPVFLIISALPFLICGRVERALFFPADSLRVALCRTCARKFYSSQILH
jgi:hypothetical protein